MARGVGVRTLGLEAAVHGRLVWGRVHQGPVGESDVRIECMIKLNLNTPLVDMSRLHVCNLRVSGSWKSQST